MDFNEEFDQAWWVSGKLGEKAASLLNQALWDAQVFNLVERRELETVMSEHDLAASGAVTPQTAVQLGKLLGADYMVLGAVTEFGWDKYEGRIPYSSRVLGGSGGELYNYNSAISVRIVNVETGEIEYMGRGSGSHRAFGVGFRGYEASAESSYDSIANETFQPAVEKIAQDIKQEASSLVTYQGFGRVADVADGEVYINRGSEDGVKVGDRFTVKRMGKEIIDPDTGKVLSRRTKTAGTIEVISVEGPHFAICKIVEGEIQPRDMIEK
jgi:curli biogenesis system outer membrane secretion channel CsgG